MDEIAISVMNEIEKSEVLSFVQEFYKREYRVCPDDLLDVCLIARLNGRLLGAIGLEFSEDDELFEIEDIFDFKFTSITILNGQRPLAVNFGRWASGVGVAGKGLAFAAVKYSIEKGKIWAVAASKPRVLNYLRSHYHLIFHSFEYALTPKPGVKFFWDGPSPRVYFWKLKEWYDCLKDISNAVSIKF